MKIIIYFLKLRKKEELKEKFTYLKLEEMTQLIAGICYTNARP